MKRIICILIILSLSYLITACSSGKETNTSFPITSKADQSVDTTIQKGSNNTPAASNKQSVSNSWTILTPMTTGRVNPGSVVYDRKIYVFGGNISRDEKTNTVEMYDPESDKWVFKTSMPTSSCIGAVLLNNMIYVIGDTIQIYDPVSDSWVEKKHDVKLTDNSGVSAANDKIYVIGGNDENAFKVFEYNPQEDVWIEKSRMKTSKRCYGIISVGNLIYTAGGNDPEGLQSMAYIEEYNPEKDIWNHIADLPIPRSDIAITEMNRKLYITGGYIGRPSNLVEEYDMDKKKWETKNSLNCNRCFHRAVTIDNKIYVIGGTDFVTLPFNSIEVYNP